jgi:hypothetical protein
MAPKQDKNKAAAVKKAVEVCKDSLSSTAFIAETGQEPRHIFRSFLFQHAFQHDWHCAAG